MASYLVRELLHHALLVSTARFRLTIVFYFKVVWKRRCEFGRIFLFMYNF